MHSKGVLTTMLLVLAVVLYPLAAASQLGGARGSSTGAPITSLFPEQTCADEDCHNGAEVNSGPGQVVIEAPAQYTPGSTLEFKVRVEEEGRSTFGFQVAVKAVNDTIDFYDHVGTLELVDPTKTRLVTENYVTHTQEGITEDEWAVRWTAPAGETRPVTIYVAGNAANGDGKRTGDHIYTSNTELPLDVGTAAEEEAPAPAFVLERAFPNPFSTQTTIRYALRHAAPVTLSVYDALGRRVRLLDLGTQAAGPHEVRLEAAGLPAGLYLYELRTPQARAARPLLLIK